MKHCRSTEWATLPRCQRLTLEWLGTSHDVGAVCHASTARLCVLQADNQHTGEARESHGPYQCPAQPRTILPAALTCHTLQVGHSVSQVDWFTTWRSLAQGTGICRLEGGRLRQWLQPASKHGRTFKTIARGQEEVCTDDVRKSAG